MPNLEHRVADARERANTLRLEGHPHQADSIDRVIDELTEAIPEYADWLGETEAMLYSGRSEEYLRARFTAWEQRDLARYEGKRRLYRRCVLEHRGNVEAAREAGRRAARSA